MFSPLDILYIVLAFCVLWFTAAVFWLIWQVASILRNVNETMTVAREKISKIEGALTAIKNKFEHATGAVTVLVEGIKKVIDYAIEKKQGKLKE
jgi:hypothetical protein